MKVIIVFQRAVKAKPSGSEELVLQMARDESRFIKPSDCTSKDSKASSTTSTSVVHFITPAGCQGSVDGAHFMGSHSLIPLDRYDSLTLPSGHIDDRGPGPYVRCLTERAV
ncbi:unnamed protein product [Arctogadus glacialis]